MTDIPAPLVTMDKSADGKTNAFIFGCKPTEQSMHYAACLHRVSAIKAGDPIPKDWSTCESQVRHCSCPALSMRQEEELAGKSLFYRARDVVQSMAAAASRWFMPGIDIDKVHKQRPKRSTSALDALDDVGTYADALNAPELAAAPKPRPVIPIAQVGETPLQIARRLQAQRKETTE